jgi:hypothetical protein
MTMVPMISPKPGVKYECEVCLDYGGLMDDEIILPDGDPYTETCPACNPPTDE